MERQYRRGCGYQSNPGNSCTVEELHLLIPHQANLRIIQAVRETLELAEEKAFVNIQKYGNTTANSSLIALNEAWEVGKIHAGDLVCFAAFGSGFTWASALVRR